MVRYAVGGDKKKLYRRGAENAEKFESRKESNHRGHGEKLEGAEKARTTS